MPVLTRDARRLAESIPVWRGERQSRVFGPLYRSSYLHAFVTGKLDDGRELALVAGTHGPNYPYLDPLSTWDDLLLVLGEDAYALSGRPIASLGLSLGPREQASITFNGPIAGRDGRFVQIDLSLNLYARIYAMRPQGLGAGPLVVGLRWRPALVVGTGALAVGDDRFGISRVVGEMERGDLNGVRGRAFQFGYEYRAAVRAAGTPAAYVAFHTFPLHAGLPLRLLLKLRPADESLTLEGERPKPGDVFHLEPSDQQATELMVEHTIDLGPAAITRQLLRFGPGSPYHYAFRERIAAHAP